MNTAGISIGDEFRPAQDLPIGSRGMVWRVVELRNGVDGLPYARLVRGNDRTAQKTVATGALLDHRLYRRVAEGTG